ncbi:MAG: hypothetical protein AVDCRST_MAG77-2354 [uncultured Chloroflexi bacterium]|uniref:Uncharacterized protein n=1 Tax=uncultured Chloroflexota bacterium TaxID=166587 RepID=A0A6J4IMG5_9CHLR|nr:MAG: hypothetical protein AVDCRST_MAG77-2354 [uncultured Chloroflexota bacterium]
MRGAVAAAVGTNAALMAVEGATGVARGEPPHFPAVRPPAHRKVRLS